MARRRPTPQRLPDAVREAVERTIQTTLGGAQQTRGRAQGAIDEVVQGAEAGAKTVRARVRDVMPATSDDIQALRAQIRALERRLDALEKGSPKPKPKRTSSRSAPARKGSSRARKS